MCLLALRGKWDAAGWILPALTDPEPEPELREAAADHFRRWRDRFNRSFSQPTPAQRERLRPHAAGPAVAALRRRPRRRDGEHDAAPAVLSQGACRRQRRRWGPRPKP